MMDVPVFWQHVVVVAIPSLSTIIGAWINHRRIVRVEMLMNGRADELKREIQNGAHLDR